MADEKAKKPEEKEEKKGAKPTEEAGEEKGLSPDAKRKEKEQKDKDAKKKGAPEKKVKKVDYGPDFKYIVRIANSDLDGTKNVEYALTGIKGISIRLATLISDLANVPRVEKIGKLTDAQIESLAKTVEEIGAKVPTWMVNRQFDWESGNDLHLVGSQVEIVLRDDLNRLKKIRSYRGLRHEQGLPVRGQRTRSHGRTGLTVGVQRKKEEEPKKEGEAGAAPAAPKGGGGAKPLGGAKPAAAPAAGAAAPAAGGAKPAAGGAKPAAKPAEGGKK